MSVGNPGEQRLDVELVGQSEKAITYANYARVDVTPWEAVITFGLIDAATVKRVEGGDLSGSVQALATVRIALPPSVFVATRDLMSKIIDERPELRVPVKSEGA
jgi:hypothetical protein